MAFPEWRRLHPEQGGFEYHLHMKNILRLTPLALILVLAACGNKGPLTLPQKPVPVETPAEPAPAPDSAASKDDGGR
ncbi:hypothetical protein CO614_09245 [Lysobacteraceae bacterium NML120232]|nr:hypothetical protein CO614_09245 [Xanthomonadaceae bacterium NML120232]